ncbi:transposase [Vibrio parahaemolyticus]|nr:transposase [Vibrio parahaemolyticus]
MAKKRTPMNKIKEVLRLKYECGLSYRSIASCLNVSLATVSELVARFKQSQIGWPLPEGCSDATLTQALYHGKKPVETRSCQTLLSALSNSGVKA